MTISSALSACYGGRAEFDPSASGGSSADGAGSDDDLEPSGVPADASCDDAVFDVSETALRRLTRREYQLTLQQLFERPERPDVERVPPDVVSHGFTAVAGLQPLSAQFVRAALETTEALGAELLADPERRAAVVGCEPAEDGCLDEFVERFGRLAFRRPLSEEEAAALIEDAELVASTPDGRVQYLLDSMLVSPHFLFHMEVGDDPEGLSTLGAFEFASRLAFTLWGRGPDAVLLEHAAAGRLDSPASREEIITQMLEDPRAREHLGVFFEQWLGIGRTQVPREPPPGFSELLLADMATETHALFDRLVWERGDLLEALTADSTFVTPALAELYGLPADGAEAQWVDIPAGHPREGSGILTHGAIIGARTNVDSIAARGAWLREALLCEGLALPSDVLEEVSDELEGLTLPELVDTRTSEPACAGCHRLIDPIGLLWVQHDALGVFDESIDADAFGLPPGLPDAEGVVVDSVSALGHQLASMPEVTECLAERAFLFTGRREPASVDDCAVESSVDRFEGDGRDFLALVRALVEAPEFRLRRAPET